MTIESVESLRAHLQTAVELEHSTLPPYLCALYSLDAGRNEHAVAVLESVVLEEMLHLTLAANLLNAVGGRPVLDAPELLPGHPTFLPHSNRSVQLSLRPFSRAAVEGFMAIERPTEDDSAQDEGYATIGQFYRAIDQALVRLCAELGEARLFSGDPARQVTDALYYGGSGRIIAVTDLASARRALAEIVEQGEGLDHGSIFDGDKDMFHPERDEVGHYFRFQELLLGRRWATGDTPSSGPSGEPVAVDWAAVAPMRVDPRVADFPAGSPARLAMDAFNISYCTVLQLLERTFDGVPTLLAIATGAMYGIKEQMLELIRLDSGDGRTTAGPSFEWVAPEQRRFADTHLFVVPHGPYLVRGAIDVFDTEGQLRVSDGICVLCRCGGSRSKPFCDGTHSRIGFDGTESADHAPMAQRRRAYPTPDGVTIYDDRTRCAHFGQCTDRLPQAFGVAEDAFVDPLAAPSEQLTAVVGGCPSGALTYAPAGTTEPAETHAGATVHPIVDGPYRVRGVQVVGVDKQPYEARERQTLCRCGNSRNKPFCDGSHWYAGFRDPLPAELEQASTFPWNEPGAADRGRERYAREQAALADGSSAESS
jgi:CDGSH-type Zn-finger protein